MGCANPADGFVEGYLNGIDAAFWDPAVRVAVSGTSISAMVARNGVVEQLRARGYKVTDPAALTGD